MQSQLIIMWPADNKVQHGAKDKQHALRSSSTSHLRKTEKTETGRAACTATQSNITSLQDIRGQARDGTCHNGQPWPASPIAQHQQRLDRDRSFFILSLPSLSLYLSISVSLSLYLSIYRYQSILPYYHIYTNSLHSFLSSQYR
jgi:hypothetical protein